MNEVQRRRTVFCVTAVIFLGIGYQAATLLISWYRERSSNLSQQLKGASLTPGNADAWDRIGETVAANFDAQPEAAIGFLEHAVRADPLSARDWMDLAQAYEASQNIAKADGAYRKAREDYPASADVAWKYGNFLLRQGRLPEGLQEVHRALLAEPSLIPLGISRVWRSNPNVKTMLNEVLPQNQQAWFKALDFFVAGQDQPAALETWKNILNLAKTAPIDIHSTFPFLQSLIARDQSEEAQQVWNEAVEGSRWPAEGTSHTQIWNGGFEEPIANGGLDWRIEGAPGTYISIDSQVHHSGEKSLRVDFTGGFNVNFWSVHQIVPVQPSTNYTFRYFIRTRDISTDSGMRFEILDPNDNEVNLMTPDMTGTNKWTSVQTEVATGRNTHFLDVRLRRLPSQLFDNKLSGTVWVDDVSLSAQAVVGSEARP